MDVISLQSGSSGNCIFVSSGETRLLFDAGISAAKAESRLAQFGHDIRDCDAVILSHEHSDHICGVGAIHRKFGLPVFANLKTWNATRAKPTTGCLGAPNHFVTGQPFQIGSLRVDTIRTPHDATDGVCFVIEDEDTGERFGLLTDLGHLFASLRHVIGTLDAVLIESNYDVEMLRSGGYPQRLKDRISGKRGHLSNLDAADLLAEHGSERLQWVCLGHLSAHNNCPCKALETHRQRHGDRYSMFCADRDGATPLPKIMPVAASFRRNTSTYIRRPEVQLSLLPY